MASQLERAVEVMDRLRSPGGCPWDAEQTHESLARYLLEETYEVLEAIETADHALLREELGDVLLQVLFHARLAEELPGDRGYSIEDVAGDLVEKLVRRHPHVFASAATAVDAAAVNETWEQQKIAEKGRTSVLDGIPVAQPALALAAKLVARAARAGLDVERPSEEQAERLSDRNVEPSSEEKHERPSEDEIGARLFAVVRDAVAAGIDPEGALRRTTQSYRAALGAAERGAAERG